MIYISLTCGLYPAKHLWLVQRKVYNPEGSDADMRCGPNFLGKNNYKKKIWMGWITYHYIGGKGCYRSWEILIGKIGLGKKYIFLVDEENIVLYIHVLSHGREVEKIIEGQRAKGPKMDLERGNWATLFLHNVNRDVLQLQPSYQFEQFDGRQSLLLPWITQSHRPKKNPISKCPSDQKIYLQMPNCWPEKMPHCWWRLSFSFRLGSCWPKKKGLAVRMTKLEDISCRGMISFWVLLYFKLGSI